MCIRWLINWSDCPSTLFLSNTKNLHCQVLFLLPICMRFLRAETLMETKTKYTHVLQLNSGYLYGIVGRFRSGCSLVIPGSRFSPLIRNLMQHYWDLQESRRLGGWACWVSGQQRRLYTCIILHCVVRGWAVCGKEFDVTSVRKVSRVLWPGAKRRCLKLTTPIWSRD